MGFRKKSAANVVRQLTRLLGLHPTKKVLMTDNIMPLDYFDNLLPALYELNLGTHMFYEQKANLSLAKVIALKQAGIAIIQPGIEALSSGLLQLMRKGVTAAQNIALLRYARSIQLSVNWNVLYAFPGDLEEHYESTLKLMPLIHHLNPPSGACHLSIDRFSPYFNSPESYGITNLRPMEAYLDVLPPGVEVESIAYHFLGDYDCVSRRDTSLVPRLEASINSWKSRWESAATPLPALTIEQFGDSNFILADTRFADKSDKQFHIITRQQAAVALARTSLVRVPPELRKWAVHDALVAVELDGYLVPLATARPDLLGIFERETTTGEREHRQIDLVMQN